MPAGSTWKYWDAGTLPANWIAPAFSDQAWSNGSSRLGFGADGEAAALESGHIAYYFRKTFNVADATGLTEAVLRFQRDDGVVIYLNGAELARDNMPAGAPTPSTFAAADINDENAWLRRTFSPSLLLPGANILCAEVHQRTATSGDLGWDAELSATGVDLSAIANTEPQTPPVLTFQQVDGDGDPLAPFHLHFSDATGRLYLLEESADLTGWQPLSYEFVRGGQLDVLLPSAPASHRFFRVRWLPALP